MKIIAAFLPCMLFSAAALAQPAALSVTVAGFENGKPIPERFAYCAPDGQGKSKSAANVSPQVGWSGAPAGTKSFALIVVDRDVPADFSAANKDGMTLPADMKRQDFYHWALVNIPASVESLAEGAGKTKDLGAQGVNDFASFMKDKPASDFLGYDGPCPPWNDARLHHYHFIVHALDVEKLEMQEGFLSKDAAALIKDHILATGEAVGTYTQNPAVALGK